MTLHGIDPPMEPACREYKLVQGSFLQDLNAKAGSRPCARPTPRTRRLRGRRLAGDHHAQRRRVAQGRGADRARRRRVKPPTARSASSRSAPRRNSSTVTANSTRWTS
ncbi:MAG: hypothetical protein MZV63_07020 [Marinilabiliales bacterium]|nr:hypothetical protein [Marinilabiliales bacterium]